MRVGHVLGPFGVAGGVKLFVIGDPGALLSLPRLYVEGRGWLRLRGAELHGPGLTVAFVGVEGREGAERLRGAAVFAEEGELPPLPDDEFYYHELRGLPVRSPAGDTIGEVVDVQDAGAQDLLVVKHALGSSLVPLQAPYVQIARRATGAGKRAVPEAVVLDAPPGLLGE